MRKTLVAVAIIAAGALAYYKFSDQTTAPQMPGLEYIPADTALLSMQTEPIDLGDYLASIGMGPHYFDDNMQQAFADLGVETESTDVKFVLALLQGYMKALSEPAALTQNTGLKSPGRNLTYMVGLSPVIKFELSDEAAFWRLFDEAEKNSGFSHVPQQLDAVSYRQYRIALDGLQFDLLVTIQQGWATIALSSEKFAPAHLSQILQASKPEYNLANTSLLKDIQQKYALNTSSFGFFSIEQITPMITGTDGNRLAKDVEALFGEQLAVAFADWRNAACQADVASISKSWPGMFFDNAFELPATGAGRVRSRMVIPTANQDTIRVMSALRGFVPAMPASSSIFHLALGIDVAQLAPSANQLWTAMTSTTYSCQPLVAMQQEMKQSNPLAALAMAGMASNLQGVSVTLNEFSLDPTAADIKNTDALLSISANNARIFVEGLKGLYPPLASVTLPADGEELDLATIIPEAAVLGFEPKLAMTDSHLLIYAGAQAKAQSAAIATQTLSKNGLIKSQIDYGKFFTLLEQSMLSSGAEVPADFKNLSQSGIRLEMDMDINAQGIVLSTVMDLPQQ